MTVLVPRVHRLTVLHATRVKDLLCPDAVMIDKRLPVNYTTLENNKALQENVSPLAFLFLCADPFFDTPLADPQP